MVNEMDRVITVQEVPNHKNKIADMPNPYYRALIDGKEIGIIAETYDIALIAGIGYKYLRHSGCFCFIKFACRMLDIKSVWSK